MVYSDLFIITMHMSTDREFFYGNFPEKKILLQIYLGVSGWAFLSCEVLWGDFCSLLVVVVVFNYRDSKSYFDPKPISE